MFPVGVVILLVVGGTEGVENEPTVSAEDGSSGGISGGGGLPKDGGLGGTSVVELIVDGVSLLLKGGVDGGGGTEDKGGIEEVGGADDGELVGDVGGMLEYELPVLVDDNSLLLGDDVEDTSE